MPDNDGINHAGHNNSSQLEEIPNQNTMGQLLIFPKKQTELEITAEFSLITRKLVGEFEIISSLKAGSSRDSRVQNTLTTIEHAKAIIARHRLMGMHQDRVAALSSLTSNLLDLIGAPTL